jgi:hypothetical protein
MTEPCDSAKIPSFPNVVRTQLQQTLFRCINTKSPARRRVKVLWAAGKRSLDKNRFYAETARVRPEGGIGADEVRKRRSPCHIGGVSFVNTMTDRDEGM